MAFVARTNQIRFNANNKPGGGPHTLRCNKCRQLIQDGDAINGPSRNRNNDPVWKDESSPSYYFKIEYWHDNCHRPQGFRTPISEPQPVIVGSNGNDGWNRATPTVTQEDNRIANENAPNPPTNAAELVTTIVTAVEANLLPQIEQAHSELEAKLDSHIRHGQTHDIPHLATVAAEQATKIANLEAKVANLETNKPVEIHITLPNGEHEHIDIGRQHKLFPTLLSRVSKGDRQIQLMGPAGSGKSEAAKALAKALGYHFTLIPIISDPVDLLGYLNVTGQYIPTEFFKAFNGEYGPTVILFDEMDAWDARAGLAANPALANGHCAFPHGTFARGGEQHHHIIALAATNTWGFGGDNDHVGRNQLDGTTLDRLTTLAWGYDESFELDLALAAGQNNPQVQDYVSAVQAVRAKALELKAKIKITPRASIDGATFLGNGMTRAEVYEARFARFQSHNMWPSVGGALINWAAQAT